MKMMKKNPAIFRAPLAILLLTLLLFSAFCLTAAADDESGVRWTYIDADRATLSGDGVIYEKITLPANCELFGLSREYIYMNDVSNAGTAYHMVRSYEKNGYLVYIETTTEEQMQVYCRSDKMAVLSAYISGAEGRYILRSPYSEPNVFSPYDDFYDLTDDFAEELRALPQVDDGVKVDVVTLKNRELYELRRQDESGLLTTLLGAVYEMPDGSFGYVDYTALDNSHFDADGHFSYRQGAVTVYPVEKFKNGLKSHSEGVYRMDNTLEYEWNEYEDMPDFYDEDTAVGSFWGFFVMIGFLVPIAPFTVGLVFANSAKMGHPKRWYLLSGLAALWIITAVLLMIVLLL